MSILHFEDIFKQIFFNFWLLGIPSKHQSNEKLGLKFIIPFCSIMLMSIEELSFFVSKISSSGNFLELTALAPCLGIGVLSMMKFLCIAMKRREIYKLCDALKEMYREILFDETKKDIMSGKVMMTQKFSKYNYVLNYVLVSLYNFSSLLLMLYDYIVKKEIVYYLPYAVSLPFSTDTFWSWLLVYIHSSKCGFLCVMYYTTVDSLYYNLSVQVCCNFAILSDEIKRLKPHQDESLRVFIKKHHHVLKLSQDLEDIFTAPNLYNVLVATLQICALGFNLMTGELKQIPVFALFLLTQLIQIFVMCFFGEKLIRESENICKKAFLCEWCDMNVKSQKTLLLIMTRANRPQKLTALKFSTISYESFSKIISTSWSYFTILRTVYNSSKTDPN